MKLHIGSITVASNVWQAVIIVVLIFVLILVLAYMSRNFLEWSLSGFGIGLVIGFILAIVIEGFLLIGGKTVLTGILSWKKAPAPIQKVLNDGHTRLLEVMNVPKQCWPNVK
jgi:Na+/H+ antiporter NhaC